jgi:FG-GAP-like repeat
MRTILLLLASGACVLGAEPTFKAVDVDTKVDIGYGVAVADVNGDKKPDILLADKNLIVWYENPSWTKHIMAEKLTKQDHVCIAAADLDGDGKAEVAVGAAWNPNDTVNSGAVFYLIPPEDRTQKWEPVELAHEPTVHRMRWVNGNLVVVPLHGRGNKAGEGAGVKILAYHKPADVKQPWPTEVLNDTLHMTHNFDPVQWDNDPEKEMLIASKEGVFLWNGKPLLQLSGTESGGAGEVRLGKLPNGKRFFATVEPMHGTNLVVYRESGSGPWSRLVLDSSLVDGHALACGDLAKSGSDQIVVGWRAMGKQGVKVGIKMFTPQDSAGDTWKSSLVDDNQMACEDLTLADLDGDGRLDIVAAGRATKNLKIYWNGAR